MKIFTPQQIHDWDAFTIGHEPVDSIDLMERAARTCTSFIIEHAHPEQNIKIFCGKGNNGGDGLAIARQLTDAGLKPVVYILEFGAKGTDDFQTNLHRLHELTAGIHFIQSADFFPEIQVTDLVIDALYGSGLNRPLQDLSAALVEHINTCSAEVISIDVPSGMFIDKSSIGNAVVKATHTLTFQSMKLCFLLAENGDAAGEVHVMDIGLHPSFPGTMDTTFAMVEPAQVYAAVKPRKPFAHKGNFGHALLIAGNTGKMGAALLAAKACLRSGTGLLTVNVPGASMHTIHSALPEAMCMDRTASIAYDKFAAMGLGPGIGTDSSTAALARDIVLNSKKPLVADADALNIIALNKTLLENIPEGSVLTPHPKEFERLFGPVANDFERIQLAVSLTEKYPIVIVLKGHYSLTAFAGKGWFNSTGNPGMAKGGSGDVLTGMLTALLAQGYDSLTAAILGVYLHGLAADIASGKMALESMLATDIIAHISDAFLSLQIGNQAFDHN